MEQKHMFTNKMIADLLIPVVLEQLLNSIMGTADTMMVSNVGSAAISAVSLVDSINVLVIQAFSALAAGGAIVCAQYIGQKNVKRANESARQNGIDANSVVKYKDNFVLATNKGYQVYTFQQNQALGFLLPRMNAMPSCLAPTDLYLRCSP